ncbi:MAG TPA: type II secretion system protein [Pirellulaceae bacterium]|jgi:prepilin-type N-terminal cleavage/methylation domain-containing protein|nr:type II secretion system protein [Pirellulaceae bacterium]
MSHSPASVSAKRRRSAFTLVEILIVVVIMAVLAATIIPSFSNSVADAKVNTAVFNLNTLRSQIEHYRAEHDGKVPAVVAGKLPELTGKTDKAGTVGPGGSYGPYLRDLPENTIKSVNTIKTITNDPPVAGDAVGTEGWLYNATTGGVWINDATHYVE